MTLNFSKISLEDRLKDVGQDTLIDLVSSLRTRNTRDIRSPFYKYELDYRIVHYFQGKGIPFGSSYQEANASLGTINKEPLKAIERGQRIKGIPKEFLKKLDDFEKIYFFAGVDSLVAPPQNIADMTTYEIASIYVRAGIERMAYLHNSILLSDQHRRAVYRGHKAETYRNAWSPPHSKKIRKRLLTQDKIHSRIEQRMIQEFGSMFAEEEKYITALQNSGDLNRDEIQLRIDEIGERIGMKLDSLQPNQLVTLTNVYGAKLGLYARTQ